VADVFEPVTAKAGGEIGWAVAFARNGYIVTISLPCLRPADAPQHGTNGLPIACLRAGHAADGGLHPIGVVSLGETPP
jgi:hypothetical protein